MDAISSLNSSDFFLGLGPDYYFLLKEGGTSGLRGHNIRFTSLYKGYWWYPIWSACSVQYFCRTSYLVIFWRDFLPQIFTSLSLLCIIIVEGEVFFLSVTLRNFEKHIAKMGSAKISWFWQRSLKKAAIYKGDDFWKRFWCFSSREKFVKFSRQKAAHNLKIIKSQLCTRISSSKKVLFQRVFLKASFWLEYCTIVKKKLEKR